MALSEREQQMLKEIEQALIADDPRFVRQAQTASGQSGFTFSLRSFALILLGLCGLIGGIALAQTSLWFVVLSIVGFLVMFAGGLLSFRTARPARGEKSGSTGVLKRTSTAGGRNSQAAKAAHSGGFADKMEDRFKRRFER